MQMQWIAAKKIKKVHIKVKMIANFNAADS